MLTKKSITAAFVLFAALAIPPAAPTPWAGRQGQALAPVMAGKHSVAQDAAAAGPDLDRKIGLILSEPEANFQDNAVYREVARQGIAILESYARMRTLNGGTMCFLSGFGLDTLGALRELADNPAANFRTFRGLLALVPTLEHPLGRANDGRDVFVDAFPGMTPRQIRCLGFPRSNTDMKRNVVTTHTLILQLTSYCLNNCRTCAGLHKNRKYSPVGQMPYPIACKILRAFQAAGLPENCGAFAVVPYDATEIAEYADTTLGADAGTLLSYASALGYLETTMFTHGRVNLPADRQGPRLPMRTVVSISVLHADVFAHVRAVLNFRTRSRTDPLPPYLLRSEAALIRKYSQHYLALIRREMDAKRPFGVENLSLFQNLEPMLFLAHPSPDLHLSSKEITSCRYALLTLTLVKNLQEVVMYEIENELGLSLQHPWNNQPIAYRDLGVAWIGQAAGLLADLGVPPRVIAQMQNLEENEFQETGKIVVNSGGGICMITNENDDRLAHAPVRTVEEIFGRPGEKGFREGEFYIFARFLGALLGDGSWTPPETRPVRLNAFGVMNEQFFFKFLHGRKTDQPPSRYRIRLGLPGNEGDAYYDRLCRLFVEPVADRLLPLLQVSGPSLDLPQIFELVRTLPVPILANLELFVEGEAAAGLKPFVFRYQLEDGEFRPVNPRNPKEDEALDTRIIFGARDPLQPQREWYAPYTAFSENPQSRTAPLDRAA